MIVRISKYLSVAAILGLASCQSAPDKPASAAIPAGVHKIQTEDVIQTSSYTYLKAKEDGKGEWIAVPSMVAKPGETYYYTGGLTMTNFNSKELNRTFDNIIFLQQVTTDPAKAADAPQPAASQEAPAGHPAMGPTAQSDDPGMSNTDYKRSVSPQEKQQVKLQPVKGGVSIKDIYSQRKIFAGKTVKIRGKVTKYTPSVMNKNWIHIQDGTDFDGKFDLAVTSETEMAVGDEVVLEGKISLDKDLGYGYFFDVILEDAHVVK